MQTPEEIAKLALMARFDDFDAGLVSCELTYPIEAIGNLREIQIQR